MSIKKLFKVNCYIVPKTNASDTGVAGINRVVSLWEISQR